MFDTEITFKLRCSWPDKHFNLFMRELEDTLEQLACDFAALANADNYEIYGIDSKVLGSVDDQRAEDERAQMITWQNLRP